MGRIKPTPNSTLKTVNLNQHTEGVDLVIGFSDGHINVITLSNELDRCEVANVFKALAVDVSLFEIH